MKSFKNFRDYIFKNLFPIYYKEQDTYKDSDGKGILERFIDVCSDYLDIEIQPDIDNYMGLIDPEKTPELFLNYLWEYFGFIPYAYGVLTKGEPYTKDNVYRWLNSPEGFPKADARKILKYAISLYKIRCTEKFYTILGRFYGVNIKLEERLPIDSQVSKYSSLEEFEEGDYEGDANLVIALYNGTGSVYGERKAGWPFGDCWSCVLMKATISIPKGMYELLEQQGRLDEVKNAFIEILNKYLPIHVSFFSKDDPNVILENYVPTLLIDAPVSVPIITTEADINLPATSTL